MYVCMCVCVCAMSFAQIIIADKWWVYAALTQTHTFSFVNILNVPGMCHTAHESAVNVCACSSLRLHPSGYTHTHIPWCIQRYTHTCIPWCIQRMCHTAHEWWMCVRIRHHLCTLLDICMYAYVHTMMHTAFWNAHACKTCAVALSFDCFMCCSTLVWLFHVLNLCVRRTSTPISVVMCILYIGIHGQSCIYESLYVANTDVCTIGLGAQIYVHTYIQAHVHTACTYANFDVCTTGLGAPSSSWAASRERQTHCQQHMRVHATPHVYLCVFVGI
jgi:hypothetical protein